MLTERELFCHARLRVTLQQVRLPDGREVLDYLRFTTAPFVVIFAMTTDGAVIRERHYKHGPGRIIFSLPAGGVEAGETPLQAAQRELLEETGFSSSDWRSLGVGMTHANAGGSIFSAFLARDCVKTAEPNLCDLEKISVEQVSEDRLLSDLAQGDMPIASDGATILRALVSLGRLPQG